MMAIEERRVVGEIPGVGEIKENLLFGVALPQAWD